MFSRFVLSLALAGACAPLLAAADAPALTLQEAIGRAVAENPILGAERAAVSAALQQAKIDALSTPITVGGEMENFAGTGGLSGIDEAEFTLRVGRTFELGGKRELRQALGESNVALRGNELERRRQDVVAQVRHRFIDVLAAQARLELAEREATLARETREAVAYRVKRGASPEADLSLADLPVARAELELQDAGRGQESARMALSVLWGERAPSFMRVEGSLDAIPDLPSFDALAMRLAATPDQQQFKFEAARLDVQRRYAESSRAPDVAGTLGVRRLEAFDDQALVMSFSLPVGLGRRADLALDRSRAELEQLEALRRSAELDRFQALFTSYQQLRQARSEIETLRERMIPAAERAVALTRRGYDEARYSFLQLSAARNVLHSLQKEHIAAVTRHHRLLVDIERAAAVSGVIAP